MDYRGFIVENSRGNRERPIAVLARKKILTRMLLPLLVLPPVAALMLVVSLPSLFGNEPAIGPSPVEQSLCLLDPDGKADVLVGGDSRALYQLIPSILEDSTQKKCVNLGQWLLLSGDPTSLVNALRKHPEALAGHPTLVISITLDAFNDLAFKGIPIVTLLNWSLGDHLRTLLHRPKAYPLFWFREMLPALGKLARRKWFTKDIGCSRFTFLPRRLAENSGFEPYEGRKTENLWGMPAVERDYLLDGGNWKSFRKSLDWIDHSPIKRVIILNAPLDTSWISAINGPVPMRMEARLCAQMEKEAERHAKATFLDLFTHPLPQIPESLFYDQYHLNHQGAIILSRWLGGILASGSHLGP